MHHPGSHSGHTLTSASRKGQGSSASVAVQGTLNFITIPNWTAVLAGSPTTETDPFSSELKKGLLAMTGLREGRKGGKRRPFLYFFKQSVFVCGIKFANKISVQCIVKWLNQAN